MADLKAYSADWLPGLDVHLTRWRTFFIVLCSDNLCAHLFVLYHLCARLFVLYHLCAQLFKLYHLCAHL